MPKTKIINNLDYKGLTLLTFSSMRNYIEYIGYLLKCFVWNFNFVCKSAFFSQLIPSIAETSPYKR